MKAKKWVTFITAGISVVSLICAICALYACCEVMYDISMAIFGSALLGFVMSLIEYFAERRKAMESFLTKASKVCSQFRKIKYVDIDEPLDLVLACIKEEQHNELCDKIEIATDHVVRMEKCHIKRDEYIAWMEANESFEFSDEDDKAAILIAIYEKRIAGFVELFHSRMGIYLDVAKTSLEDLSNAYGNMDFLFANKKIRQSAYESIYSKLSDWRNQLLVESHHFELAKEGRGNFSVCVHKLLELNDMFFKTEEQQTSQEIHTVVYQHLFDDVSESIERFRCATYFKKDIVHEKRTPILSKIRRKNIPSKTSEAE